MSFSTLYMTEPRHQEYHTFGTQAELTEWDAMVLALKAESSSVMERRIAVGGSITNEIRSLYEQWMTNVKAFRDRFGEDKVPQDIKWALNSAEEGLGIEITQWTNPPDASLFE